MNSQEYERGLRGVVVNEAPPLEDADVCGFDGVLCFGYERFYLKGVSACLSLCFCYSVVVGGMGMIDNAGRVPDEFRV